MDTAIKHTVPDQVKLSFVIFDIRALHVTSYTVWHGMLYSCIHMATVGLKRLKWLIVAYQNARVQFSQARGNYLKVV